MKKITFSILVTMLAGFATAAFTQQIKPPKNQLSAKDYISKSNDQLVFGCLLAGAGTGLIVAGANTQKNATGFDFSGTFMEAAGVLAIGGSIPLFIGAIHNHKKGKAISANIKFENSLSLQQLKVVRYFFPALSVSIRL
jgi:hypothetical protein